MKTHIITRLRGSIHQLSILKLEIKKLAILEEEAKEKEERLLNL